MSFVDSQVVVLTSTETKEVLERWEFKVEYEEGEDQTEGSKENVDSNVTSQTATPKTSQKGYRNVSNKVMPVTCQLEIATFSFEFRRFESWAH